MSEKTKPLTPSNNYIWDLEVELRCAENPSVAKMYYDDTYKPSMRTLKKEMRILEEACDYHHAMFLDEKYYDMLHADEKPFILPEHSQETLDTLNEFMYSKIHSAVHSPNSEYYVPVVANSVPMEEMLVPWLNYKEQIKGVSDENELERLKTEAILAYADIMKSPCNLFAHGYDPSVATY